jgi:uncharacterized protein (DUF427 family)
MKAIWNNQIIAEAEKDDLIRIEGNWYFPPSSIHTEFFVPSDTHTVCFWKGEASYYTLKVGDQENADAAWYYPNPKEGSVDKVGKDFTNFVAFWRGVEVAE